MQRTRFYDLFDFFFQAYPQDQKTKDYYLQVLNRLLDLKTITNKAEFTAWIYLAFKKNLSQQKVAQFCEVSIPTVSRGLKELKMKGFPSILKENNDLIHETLPRFSTIVDYHIYYCLKVEDMLSTKELLNRINKIFDKNWGYNTILIHLRSLVKHKILTQEKDGRNRIYKLNQDYFQRCDLIPQADNYSH